MDSRADDERLRGRGRARLHRRVAVALDGSPALTLVAALRNEQYGGDLFGRARSFLQNVEWLARRRRASVEVILVEWAPLEGRPPLGDILRGAVEHRASTARVVTVPREVAVGRFEQADEIALWIFAAKNVGIRRARAPFIVATNPDVLYTPALFAAIARGRLSEGSFYRTTRLDVSGIPSGAPPRVQLAHCRHSVVRANLLGDSLSFERPVGGLRLARAIRRREAELRESAPRTSLERAERPTHWLHTNASGDFFLMHRRHWQELLGYPEFASAGHLDSYMCVEAASAGLRQVVLGGRRRLYHVEHTRAIDWERPDEARHYYVPYDTFLADAREMLLAGSPKLFNDERWGLGDVELPETRL